MFTIGASIALFADDCSGSEANLRKIAIEFSEKPFFPLTATCCAFAGGQGLLHEELTKSATREEASEATREDRALYLCANRTCELCMEHSSWPARFQVQFLFPKEVNSQLAVRDSSLSVRDLSILSNGKLLMENWRSAAHALPFQGNIYFDTVGDLNEGNIFVHSVVFAIEGHRAVNASGG